MRRGVSARTILALTAAAGTLSLGILAANFGSVAPQAAAQAPCAPPGLARLAEGGRRRGRRGRIPGHALGGAACDRPDRAHAATRRPVDELSGRVQRAQRRLLPRPQARAGRGGPEGRPGCPGRGGFRTIPGSPRGRRRLRQRAWRPRARRSRSEESRRRSGQEESRRSRQEEGRRRGA